MILNLAPQAGRDYGPGWAGFTFHLDSAVLSPGIAIQTARQEFAAGRFVPSHVFTVLDGGELGEANPEGYVVGPLAKYLDPQDARVLVAFRRPRGLTPNAAELMCLAARLWADAGTPYDFSAIAGFVLADPERLAAGLRNRLEHPGRVFCSEAHAALMQLAAGLHQPPLPPEFAATHPSSLSPWGLWCAPVWG